MEESQVLPVSLSQHVYEILLQKMLSNELVSGQILNRRAVASDLGVSVAPVLEAMIKLEMEGFLESIPRKGTQVRPITAEDIYGQLIVREALECEAARLYCGEPIEANEAALHELCEDLNRTPTSSIEHWQEDLDLHFALIELTGVDALINECHRALHLSTFYAMNRLAPPNGGADTSNHWELVQKLKTRDSDEAERTIREHMRAGKEVLVREAGRY